MRSHRVTPPSEPKDPFKKFAALAQNARFDITMVGRGVGKSYVIGNLSAFQEVLINEQVRIHMESKTNKIIDITEC